MFSRAVQASFSLYALISIYTISSPLVFLGSTGKFSSICPAFPVLHLLTTDFLGSTSKFFSICPDFHIHYQFTIGFPGSTSKFSSICPKSTIIFFIIIKNNTKMYLKCIRNVQKKIKDQKIHFQILNLLIFLTLLWYMFQVSIRTLQYYHLLLPPQRQAS